MIKMVWLVPVLMLTFSGFIQAESYKTAAKIEVRGDFTLLPDGTAVGLAAGTGKNIFGQNLKYPYKIDKDGAKLLPGFPEPTPTTTYYIDYITRNGVMFGERDSLDNQNYTSEKFVYVPAKGYFNLSEEYKKSAYAKENALDFSSYDEMRVNDQGVVAGDLGFDEPLFLFDAENGFRVLPDTENFELISINNHNDLLLRDENDYDNPNYVIYSAAGKITKIADFGIRDYLKPFLYGEEKEYKDADAEELYSHLKLLDDGSVVGFVEVNMKQLFPTDYDENDSFFIRYPDGSLYISGITDVFEANVQIPSLWTYEREDEDEGDPPLFYVKRFYIEDNVVILDSEYGDLYRFTFGDKKAEKIEVPKELKIYGLVIQDGKVTALAKERSLDKIVNNLVIWKEGSSIVKLIDLMDNKDYANFDVEFDVDIGNAHFINDKGDLLLNVYDYDADPRADVVLLLYPQK